MAEHDTLALSFGGSHPEEVMAKKVFSRKLFEEAGRKGGSVKGEAKARGQGVPNYYADLARLSHAKRKAKREADDGKRPGVDRSDGGLAKGEPAA